MDDRPRNSDETMEDKSPFNLNDAIRQWRGALGQSGALGTDDLAELERHLLDSMAELPQGRLTEEESFLIASRRLGADDMLTGEFTKLNPARIWEPRLCWILFGILLYPFLSDLNGLSLLAIKSVSKFNINGHILGLIALATEWGVAIAIMMLFFWIMRQKREFCRHWAARLLARPITGTICVVVLLIAVKIVLASPQAFFGVGLNLPPASQARVVTAITWQSFGPTSMQLILIPVVLVYLSRRKLRIHSLG